MSDIIFPPDVQVKFDAMIANVPGPMQSFAKKQILGKIQQFVTKEGRTEVTIKDVVDGFFAATPFGFHGPMKTDFKSIGIDYTQYGYSN